MLPNFGKAVLILMAVLLIPTGLVLASQNAVPGDKTYPVKRTLENGITVMASLHPVTRSYFKTDFSKRRFNEAMTLVNRGDNATSSLDELVVQTKAATDSIIAMSDKNLRKQFAGDLSKQIDNYNKTLTTLEEKKRTQQPKVTPSPTQIGSTKPIFNDDYQKTLEELKRIREELEKLKQQLNAQAAAQKNSNNLAAILTSTPAPTGGGPAAAADQGPVSTPVPTKEPEDEGECSAMEILKQRVAGDTGSGVSCKSTPTPGISFTPTPTTASDSSSIQGVSIKILNLRESIVEMITNFFH